ncbi:MAG: biotin--[acetyl-CoA-carboxylase] ligase [Clostridia bacterium]|nr:biotin--[acetyl-CoA-carboxylase] ligase [Clostridia bacterium]
MRRSRTKDDILNEICKGEVISGGMLASRLGISRTAVWKAVNALRAQGFFIDGVGGGYMLSPYNTRLCNKQAEFAVKAERLIFKEKTDSTNEDAKKLAEAGAEEFTVVLAKKQTGGKGRLGRSFFSPEGGLYFSVILRPELPASACLKITTAAAVSMAKAIMRTTNCPAKIKWVNDIYISSKKVCGILTEGAFDAENGRLKYAVLGIGVNVGTPKGGFPEELEDKAGALFDTSAPPSLVYFSLVNEFLSGFREYYKNVDEMPHIEEYRKYSLLDGKIVSYKKDGKTHTAEVCGIGDNAELIVKDKKGERPLLSGEVTITNYE